METIIQKESIIFDINSDNKNEAIYVLIKKLKELEKITDIESFYQDILYREKIASTAIGYKIGLPHGRTKNVLQPAICFGKLTKEIIWNEETNEAVEIIILIAVPQDYVDDLYIQILSKLARKLMHEEFRNKLLNSNQDELYLLLNEGIGENEI